MTRALVLAAFATASAFAMAPADRSASQGLTAAPAQTTSRTLLVIPFENKDARLAWLREGASILLTDYLTAAGETAIDRGERLRAYERLQYPAPAVLSRASTIKVGQAVTATDVISGRFEVQGDELIVRARVVQLEPGRLLPELEARGPTTDLYGVFTRMAQAIRASVAPIPPVGDRLPALAGVFELYVKGLLADAPATGLAFLEQVLKSQPQFDRARLAMWELHTEAGDHEKAHEVIARVAAGSGLAREARFLDALSLMNLKKFDDALVILRALQTEQPAAAVANAIGVAELRRASTVQPGRATYYFSQAAELDPSDGNLFFNLGYAYWLDKDPPASIYWLREAVRRDPADGDAHFILAAALHQTGASSEAARERELATRLSSKYAGWEAKTPGGDPVPQGLERLAEELNPRATRLDAQLANAGQRDQESLAKFHLDAGRRAYEREADREAIQELRRALYLSPYLAEAHLLLGRTLLRGGRIDDAVEALKIALWSEETVAAHVALAEAFLQAQDNAAARVEIDRALALDPKSAEALRVKARLGGGPW